MSSDSASISVTTPEQHDTIYLDNAATTPVLEEVFLEMMPYLRIHFGNPSSLHRKGYVAKRAISIARNRVASIIGA